MIYASPDGEAGGSTGTGDWKCRVLKHSIYTVWLCACVCMSQCSRFLFCSSRNSPNKPFFLSVATFCTSWLFYFVLFFCFFYLRFLRVLGRQRRNCCSAATALLFFMLLVVNLKLAHILILLAPVFRSIFFFSSTSLLLQGQVRCA